MIYGLLTRKIAFYIFKTKINQIQESNERASLVVKWLRIRVPTQGTWVLALVREDPTCCGATKPLCHNY